MPTRFRLRMPPIDMPLALASFGLVAIGLAMVYSATSIPGAHEGLRITSKDGSVTTVSFRAANPETVLGSTPRR